MDIVLLEDVVLRLEMKVFFFQCEFGWEWMECEGIEYVLDMFFNMFV